MWIWKWHPSSVQKQHVAWRVKARVIFRPHSLCSRPSLAISVYSIWKIECWRLSTWLLPWRKNVCSSYQYLLSTYYMPGSIPGIGILLYLYQVVNKISKVSALWKKKGSRQVAGVLANLAYWFCSWNLLPGSRDWKWVQAEPPFFMLWCSLLRRWTNSVTLSVDTK